MFYFLRLKVNRGKIYSDLGDKNLALVDFNHAININPELAEAYFNAANIYLSKKEFTKGWLYYEKRNHREENEDESVARRFQEGRIREQIN